MRNVIIKNKRLTLPERWNELTVHQLRWICKYIYPNINLFNQSPTIYYHLKVRLLMVLMEVPRYNIFSAKRRMFFKISAESLADLTMQINWIYQSANLTLNPFPAISIGFKKLYGPPDGLSNMKLIEFSFADHFFCEFQKTKKESDLNNFIACLYRHKMFNNADDVREPFNKNTIAYRATLLKNFRNEDKIAILLFYLSCRELIVKRYAKVFEKTNNKGKTKNFGMAGLIVEMAGTKFGNVTETEQTDINAIFIYLETQLTK